MQLDLNAILHQHLIFSPKWTSEFDFDGRNISEQSTTVWLHDQKFLRTKWKFIAGEENVHQREITWYWDPVKQVVRNQIFDSDGEWGQTTIEIEKDSLHDRREFADRIGDPHSSVFLMKRTEPDSFTFHKEGGLTLKFQSKN